MKSEVEKLARCEQNLKSVKAKFNAVVSLVESLGDNGYKDVVWCGKEFTVGIDGSGRYTLLVPHGGTLYFNKLENFISDLFRLAIGDNWTEMIDWRH